MLLLFLFSMLIFFLPGRELWNEKRPYLAIILGVYFLLSMRYREVFIPRASLRIALIMITGIVVIGAVGERALLLSALGNAVLIFLGLPYLYWLAARFTVRTVAWLIVFVVLLHAQWGVLQFALQSSLSLHLLGEAQLDPMAAGIAKFSLAGGEKIVRAYGPHPHANPFGGWMLLGLIALLLTRTRSRLFILLPSFWLLLGSLLSFSRAAWLGAGIWLAAAAFRRQQMHRLLLIGGLMVATLLPLIGARLADREDAAAAERLTGGLWALHMVRETPLWISGVGWGNYVEALAAYLDSQAIYYQPWQLDYVHSVPLLLLAELGVVGMLLTVLGLWFVFRARWWRAGMLLAPLIPAAALDHYLLTQPAPLLVLLALLVLIWIAEAGPGAATDPLESAG